MSHAPERWTTRAPSPATVTWTSGSQTCIDDSPSRQASSNAAGTQRHDSAAFAYNRSRAPVAQWIEQPPPKGQVGRSIRLRGAKLYVKRKRKGGIPGGRCRSRKLSRSPQIDARSVAAI